MTFKLKSIMAVSAATLLATAAPSYAGTLDGMYASIRVGIIAQDDGTNSSTSIESFASRLGYKGETKINDGLTGFGKLEFGVDVEDNEGSSTSIRQGLVGVKGDFGKLFVGQSYHTFYNFTVAPVDIPWWNAGYNMLGYTGRTAKGLTYAKSFGDFKIGATTYLAKDDTDDEGNVTGNGGTELGVSYDFGNVKVAAGYRDVDAFDDALTALTVSGKAGEVGLGATFQKQGDDDSVEASITYKSFYVQTGSKGDASATTLGYTHSVGPKTTMWFELLNNDKGDGSDNATAAIATLKYDIF